ncbi:alpha/beta fold hydrolase [Nocardia sp. NPDC059246]|uniref:alpha/beta fold hydrolase n=1 Tax=unclassified Nocardia TaxID=2637762 RepID=UPI0036BB1360
MTSTDTPARFTYTARDGLEIVAYKWIPAAPPRGIVQLTHGMGEHVRRYHDLAMTLTEAGYLVAGQDHRGHGATARPEAGYGTIGAAGWGELVNDIHLLNELLRAHHPSLPLILIAHSMGSFAAQQYLLEHSAEVDAVVLTGTGLVDLIEPVVDLDQPLDLALFNAPFAPARTDFDWLSRDESCVDAYIADPQCGFGIDVGALKALFAAGRAIADPQRMHAVRPDLRLYITAGDQDPVNGQLTGIHTLIDRYLAAGLTDVALSIYRGARHELYNEIDRRTVMADLIAWIDRTSTAPPGETQ